MLARGTVHRNRLSTVVVLVILLGAAASGGAEPAVEFQRPWLDQTGIAPLACDPELCDGIDNDCDGDIDEDFDAGAACTVGAGACTVTGVKICAPGGAATVCGAVAPVTLGVPDGMVGEPAQEIVVPLNLSEVTGMGVLSADVVVAFDPAVAQLTLAAAGTLTSGPGCLLTPNLLVPGQATISVFCADELSGSGSLAELTFLAVGPGGSSTSISVLSAQINEGAPAVCADGGSLDICGADTDCDGVDDDCDGTADEGYIPSATTCGMGACQTSGQLTCVGGIEIDSCSSPVSLGIDDGIVTAPAQGIVVPLALSDVTGLGVLSADVVVAYDPLVVQATSVAAGTLTSDPGCLVTPSLLVPGQITISVFCTVFMTGSGTLAAITFDAVGSGGASTPLVFASSRLNEGSPPLCADDGSVDICGPAGSDNDCDGADDDCSGTADQDYESIPTTCGSGACAATGNTTCIGGVEGDTCVTNAVTLSLPDGVSTILGETIVVPVQVTSLTGLDVFSSDLDVAYDSAVLRLETVSAGSLTGACTLTENLANPGHIVLSIFCTSPLSGSGSLAEATFRVTGGYGSASTLVFSSVMLNEGIPASCVDDGSWRVCGGHQTETCDSLDNDCDGTADEGYAVGTSCILMPGTCPPPAHMVCMPNGLSSACVNDTLLDVDHDVPATAAMVKWQSIPGALLYDIVRGDILILGSTGGDFTGATELCVANDIAATSVLDPDTPLPREGFWYLMRAAQCSGGATYEEGSFSQVGLRDPEIQLSGRQCP